MRLMFLPLSIKSLQNAQKLKNVQPELQKLAIEAKHLVTEKEREAQEKGEQVNEQTNMRIMLHHKRKELYQREGISFVATFSTLLQIPFFAGLFFALRSMRDQLHHGGALWFTDLAEPDYALAGMLTALIMLGHEVNTRSKWSQSYSMPEGLRARSRIYTRLMVLLVGVVASQLEGAILMYWIPSTLIQISANMALTSESVRARLGIPASLPWSLEQLEKYDMQLADARQERNLQRMQEERTRQLHEERAARINEMSHQLHMQFQEIAQEMPELKKRLQEIQSAQESEKPLSTSEMKQMVDLVNDNDQRESIRQALQQIEEAQHEMDVRMNLEEAKAKKMAQQKPDEQV